MANRILQEKCSYHRVAAANAFFDIMKATVQSQTAPLLWHKSDAFSTGKGSGVGGLAWRWLHLFDPVGSRFDAAFLTTDKAFDPEFHGFVVARTRIEPLIIQQVMQSRLQAGNMCALRCFEDITIAFGAVDKLLQEEVNSEVAQADFTNLTQQRIDYCCFVLRTFDGDICLLPQQGVLAGDTFPVNIFRNSCRRVVVEWEASVTDPLRFFFRARTPDGRRVDCSKCIYADDIGKLILVGRQTAQRRNTNKTAVTSPCTSPIYEYARKNIPQYNSQQQNHQQT